jgi:hypothetical protein
VCLPLVKLTVRECFKSVEMHCTAHPKGRAKLYTPFPILGEGSRVKFKLPFSQIWEKGLGDEGVF